MNNSTESSALQEQLKNAELSALQEHLAVAELPTPPESVRTTESRAFWRIEAIGRIRIPGQKDRFMSLNSREGFVVYIDPQKFYFYWLRSDMLFPDSYLNFNCPIKKEMPKDRKYHLAVDDFSDGIDNPVPLADLGCAIQDGQYRISFTEGITRTMWLLANDAHSFPMWVRDEEGAYLLNQIAGLTDTPIPAAEIL